MGGGGQCLWDQNELEWKLPNYSQTVDATHRHLSFPTQRAVDAAVLFPSAQEAEPWLAP